MRKLIVLFGAMLLALLPATGALAQSSDEGQVVVVHGVPDLTVDVYVNGDLTLEDFEFGTVAGPLTLPAGTYDLEVYPADADPSSSDPALAGSTELPGGAYATIAAYLQEGGDPTLGVFVENNSSTAAGEARVTARHLADFGAVDIDADLNLAEGTNTIAYAIGSVAGGSFQVVANTITGLQSAPEGVPTGTAGLAGGSNLMPVVLLALGLAGLAGGAALVARGEQA